MSTRLFPLAFMYVSGAMQNVDNSLLEASSNLGASGLKKFWKIGISLCMPAILASALMIFMRAFADFGTPLMIGEGYRTFPVEIYNQFVGETGTDYNFAAAISVIAIAITALVFFIQQVANKRFQFTMNVMNPIERKKPKLFTSLLLHFYAYGLVFVSMLPQLFLIYTSFRKSSKSGFAFVDGYSFGNYADAFKRMGKGVKNEIWNTVSIGVVTLAVIIILAILIAYLVVRRKSVFNNTIDTFSMIPYIIPGSVVGIALATSFSSGWLVLTGTATIMIIAMSIRRIPYTIRSSIATLQQIPMSIEEAAISLGSSKPKTFFRITVPMMSAGIISGAILSWVSIITELSSSIMLYSARNTTLTVMVYSLVNRGTYGQATAVATILTVFTVISLVLFNMVSKSENLKL
ncbi:MAG: ABC transporter permease [Sphaerochaetaceae bacterium]